VPTFKVSEVFFLLGAKTAKARPAGHKLSQQLAVL